VAHVMDDRQRGSAALSMENSVATQNWNSGIGDVSYS